MSGWSAAAGPSATGLEEVLLPTPKLVVTSPVLKDLGKLPAQCHREAGNISPPLAWTETPRDARALVLVLEERCTRPRHTVALAPAPELRRTLWTTWTNDPRLRWLPAGESFAVVGTNDHGTRDYEGPSLRKTHRRPFRSLVFCLFALDTELELADGATRQELDDAMFGHVVAAASLACAPSDSGRDWIRIRRELRDVS